MILTSNLLQRIQSVPYDICAILQVGSHQFPELVDAYSDIDLCVLVKENGVDTPFSRDWREDNVHWKYISMHTFFNWISHSIGKEFHDMSHAHCYSPLSLSTLTDPLFETDYYHEFISSNLQNLQDWIKVCAFNYLIQHRSYALRVISEKYSDSIADKQLHHIIHSYYIVESKCNEIPWSRLHRIKRAYYKSLSHEDAEYVNNIMLELLKHIA
jgi:hypothetical protein